MIGTLYEVLKRPLITEKSNALREDDNQYAFEVNPLATKIDIRNAIEELFEDVKVKKVRIQNRRGKPRRYRFRYGVTKAWKKAIITLDPESKGIDFF